MSRLLLEQVTKQNGKRYICGNCLNSFCSEDKEKISLPENGIKLSFKNFKRSMCIPFQ